MLKRIALLTFALCTLALTSCKEDCDAPPVDENIIGEWTVATGGEVEFQADGTLVDPDDALIGSGNPDAVKTWTIFESDLTVSVVEDSSSFSGEFPIVENECDEITINFLGINIKMKRK